MAALTPVMCSRVGGGDITAGMATATSGTGDTMPTGPNSYIRVKNANASTCQVSVVMPAGTGPLGTTYANYNLSPVVAASTGDRIFGPFPQSPFGDSNSNVTILCVPAASVTIQALNCVD